jgi:crossover junction endodeoxyribonuclease RusA
MDRWEILYKERPFTLNAERNWHYHKRAKKVKEWRDFFYEESKKLEIPKLEAIGVEVYPIFRDRRLQDVTACEPAVKAAIDGIVDSGVIPDDNPRYLKYVCFNRPVVKDHDGLLIVIMEQEEWIY